MAVEEHAGADQVENLAMEFAERQTIETLAGGEP